MLSDEDHATADLQGFLDRLLAFLYMEDFIEGNPFSVDEPRHSVWENATRNAREELALIESNLKQTGPLPSHGGMGSVIDIATKRFDVWAKRASQFAATEDELIGYSLWLIEYAEVSRRNTIKTIPGCLVVNDQVRFQLLERVYWWEKAVREGNDRKTGLADSIPQPVYATLRNRPEVQIADYLAPKFARAVANLSDAGLTNLGASFTRDAYLAALGAFDDLSQEAVAAALPEGKVRTQLGTQAAVERLSRRWAQLAEDYFSDFARKIDEICEKSLAAGSDRSSTEKWHRAVVNEYARTLWRDVRDAWTGWLDQVRSMTEGTSFGVKLRFADDRESVTLEGHMQRMSETLARIANRHTLPDEVVNKLMRWDDRQIGFQDDPASPESSRGPDPIFQEVREDLTEWKSIRMSFFNEHSIEITTPARTIVRQFEDLGMADKRTSKPTRAWECLQHLAKCQGVISVPESWTPTWPKIEKRVQEIRKWLRTQFGIATDPIPFVKNVGYKARFQINLAASYHR